MLDVGAPHSAQFSSLDYPSAAQALDHLLAADMERQVVREPVVSHGERGQHGRFVSALVFVFDNHHLVELAARATYTTHRCDEHQRAHRVGVLSVLRTAVVDEPSVDALDAIPAQAVEIVPNGMKAVQARNIAYYGA